MKCLSIRQPWAWAILHAGKRIENRSWATTYRGPILLHASAAREIDRCMLFGNWLGRGRWHGEDVAGWAEAMAAWPRDPGALPRGGIVGRAEIVDCISVSTSPWFEGPWGLVLANVEALPFRPLKGRLGLFEVEEV